MSTAVASRSNLTVGLRRARIGVLSHCLLKACEAKCKEAHAAGNEALVHAIRLVMDQIEKRPLYELKTIFTDSSPVIAGPVKTEILNKAMAAYRIYEKQMN